MAPGSIDFDIHDLGIHGCDRNHLAGRERARRRRARGLGCLRQSAATGAQAANPAASWAAIFDSNLRIAPAARAKLPDRLQQTDYNPFISHDFLSALERSGSVRNRTGWQPMHLLAQAGNGAILGVAPCYAKSHSQGEYVFDHGWAEAYERAGGSYYPKLQVSVPFTPATGRRLLVRPGPQAQAVRGALADGLAEICRRSNASSVHVTFPTEPEWELLGHARLSVAHPSPIPLGKRRLRSPSTPSWPRSRRASARPSGASAPMRWRRHQHSLALRLGPDRKRVGRVLRRSTWRPGRASGAIPTSPARSTRWSARRMRDRILLVMAKRNGRWIAGAINFIGSRHAVRPPLGRHRAASVPAFRGLLLSGDPIRHRAQARAGRGRRAGPAQDRPRLSADHHLFGALHRRSGIAAGGGEFPRARARRTWPRRSRSSPKRRRSARTDPAGLTPPASACHRSFDAHMAESRPGGIHAGL